MLSRLAKILAIIVVALGALAISVVGPIDRSPLHDKAFYKRMQERLDSIRVPVFPGRDLRSGWARVNITPATPMPMAGYSPRDRFDSVHDSLYARILVIDNAGISIAFINVDLLLFPTRLKQRIDEKIDSLGSGPFLYLSATHTHNGVGGWDKSPAGRIAFGNYQDEWVENTATGIVRALGAIKARSSKLNYWEADASDRVQNRLDRELGETDGMIRGIQIKREDSLSAILFTFSAHPTSIDKDSYTLSADYPGAVIGRLEENYDFGMFMAGMVGSHRFAWVPETGFELIDLMTPVLIGHIDQAVKDSAIVTPEIRAMQVPIEFGPAQPRISENWKIRDWVMRLLARPLQGDATFVEIGNIIFIGLPCDFSGEIFRKEKMAEIAATAGKRVIITSFNGEYNGYITWDEYYEHSKAEEVNATNWVGPGYGEYFARIIEALITAD